MKTRKLRQIEVSEIGMGCMGFSHGYGNAPERAYSIRAIQEAYEYGCTFFDTAETYGTQQFYPGHNEQLVGEAKIFKRTMWICIIFTALTRQCLWRKSPM